MEQEQTKSVKEELQVTTKRTYIPQLDVPIYALDEALKIPRAIIDNYGGHFATPLQVASALNVTPQSGGFRNLCGSSIAYGLTEGGYSAKEISVTPLVKRIIAPLEEGDDLTAKREAALKPRILGEFIRKYENSPLPRRDIALNVLLEMGVPRERAESVYNMVLDTAGSVGLIKEIKGKQYIDLSGVHVAIKLDEEAESKEEGFPEAKHVPIAITKEERIAKKRTRTRNIHRSRKE